MDFKVVIYSLLSRVQREKRTVPNRQSKTHFHEANIIFSVFTTGVTLLFRIYLLALVLQAVCDSIVIISSLTARSLSSGDEWMNRQRVEYKKWGKVHFRRDQDEIKTV